MEFIGDRPGTAAVSILPVNMSVGPGNILISYCRFVNASGSNVHASIICLYAAISAGHVLWNL